MTWIRPIVILGCLLALALVAGCEPSGPMFCGVIEYRNRSNDTLYVSDLTGFKRPAQCGYLLPNQGPAELNLGWIKYPREATIVWRVGDGADRSQVLDLDAALANNETAALVIEYTKEGVWKVTPEQRKR